MVRHTQSHLKILGSHKYDINHLQKTIIIKKFKSDHAYQMLITSISFSFAFCSGKQHDFVGISVKFTALITFCHFKVPAYAFDAFKDITVNTEFSLFIRRKDTLTATTTAT